MNAKYSMCVQCLCWPEEGSGSPEQELHRAVSCLRRLLEVELKIDHYSLTRFISILCVLLSCLLISFHHVCALVPAEARRLRSGTGVTDVCEFPSES